MPAQPAACGAGRSPATRRDPATSGQNPSMLSAPPIPESSACELAVTERSSWLPAAKVCCSASVRLVRLARGR